MKLINKRQLPRVLGYETEEYDIEGITGLESYIDAAKLLVEHIPQLYGIELKRDGGRDEHVKNEYYKTFEQFAAEALDQLSDNRITTISITGQDNQNQISAHIGIVSKTATIGVKPVFIPTPPSQGTISLK